MCKLTVVGLGKNQYIHSVKWIFGTKGHGITIDAEDNHISDSRQCNVQRETS
jgi:hypothetical protein